jgi:hypothetical protein
MLAIFAVPAAFGITLLVPAAAFTGNAPDCGTGHTMILAAQAVPSAAFLPCVAALPVGWTTVNDEIASGRASFGLDSGSLAGGGGVHFVLGQSGQLQTVTITLTATCDMAGARQIPSGRPGMRRFERPPSLVPGYSDVRYDVFPGGCVTYRFVLGPGASPVLAATVGSAVAFIPRSELVGYVRRTEGLALCGRGAGCPG